MNTTADLCYSIKDARDMIATSPSNENLRKWIGLMRGWIATRQGFLGLRGKDDMLTLMHEAVNFEKRWTTSPLQAELIDILKEGPEAYTLRPPSSVEVCAPGPWQLV